VDKQILSVNMKESQDNRREFIRNSVSTAAGLFMLPLIPGQVTAAKAIEEVEVKHIKPEAGRIKFSVIGLNHGHIYGR
jgi:hypothetical protein